MKQNEAVILTIEKLGGVATLGQLNQEVFKISDCEWKTKTPFASIRRIVQLDKNIYKIKPGLYGLLDYKVKNESKGIIEITDENKNSKEAIDFNHSYFQGLLLKVGNLKGFKTFVPNQDKNRLFLNEKLVDIRTLDEIPKYSYPKLVNKSASVDVIWFNEREMPHSFFEVEHSTDIQNSLLKFNELQDFYSRMVIVADSKRKEEYLKKLKYSSFTNLVNQNRVSFMDYEALNKQYETVIEQQHYEFLL
ncbi:hypothetical protein [Flavobacterium nackdongense]|uniref:HTH HARE-type domain-containing protein n=1 Tax=Flavobacterium nackdongense TaxID=2547394 RepID=A0A4P6YBS4_9FLAO|nr:hypothetical protein [Flavobacterium nackdongense]QBN17733.1 hypothetical protein E1750_02580 [Flavobacterium nackdongense]